MLTLSMNDAAVEMLGLADGAGLMPPEGLSDGLRELLARGITRQGEVISWGSGANGALDAPGNYQNLSVWESSHNSFHLEDYVPVDRLIVECVPQVSEDAQRVLLRQGFALAMGMRGLFAELDPPAPVRFLIAANDTCATFRFVQVREGEAVFGEDLDAFRTDRVLVVEYLPNRYQAVPKGLSIT
ncbi:hypothetical protein [Kitasatospora sp. NPDC101183]|uniref:hypothetical protein n=1 Tax=Kitasatospora sp. NPDC101183 TaxID=3364100 RepID=UPI00380703AB